MKLSKIYSNSNSFKEIIFNDGFNVVFGDIRRDDNDDNEKVSEHCIGKTSLVYLIDFLLLKQDKKGSFFNKNKDIFKGWVFFLEIKLNDGKYLTIRRSIDDCTKVSLKEHFSHNQNFINENIWDFENFSINAKDEKQNAKHILENNYLKFDINNTFTFRSFLSYLLRTQDDYRDVFKLNKFRGSDRNWKPALFNLLGFDYKNLIKKYDLDDIIEIDKKEIKKIFNNDNEIYEIRAAIEAKELEKNDLQKNIDNFNFYNKEQNINFSLVDNIENSISKLNKEEYILNSRINQIKKTLDSKNNVSIDMDQIKELFEEIKISFPDNLLQDYSNVIEFSLQITQEREKYLKEELTESQEKQKCILQDLKKFDIERANILSVLKEKNTFIKYKKYQQDLIDIENEIFTYKKKLEFIDSVDKYRYDLERNQDKLKNISDIIKGELSSFNDNFINIKRIFQDIYKKTFDYTALLIIRPNKNNNIDFETSVLGFKQNLTGKADGHTSTMILCAAFVLSILVNYYQKSFFRFAYHDGIMESWGDRHKINFINLVREYCEKYKIQYIISCIKSDIPADFEFKKEEIIITLSNENRLFGIDF